jgi:hypothetical protein
MRAIIKGKKKTVISETAIFSVPVVFKAVKKSIVIFWVVTPCDLIVRS